ncbi:MAG: recombinase family protein [Labilithrix sp.]|nr:recombinase family protein [Labilithrix sp.]MCW5809485.1 recombinase family protein [Labilithrix sp.]
MPIRVALYLRRSTEEHQEASLEVQEEEARRFLQKKFGTYVVSPEHVFVDSGVSRAEFAKRPGLIALLSAIEKKEVDVLVTRDETRLGGDMIRVSLLLQDILDAGVRVYYYYSGEEVRLDDATARFLITARNFAAELEREKISQRTHEHLLVKARKGLNVGGRVYGYDNVEVMDGERRKHVEYRVNAEQAAVVLEIFTRFARGEGYRTIAKELNARGLPSPSAGKRGTGSWSPSAVFEIIHRERYLGRIVWNKFEKMYRKGTKVRVERPEHEWLVVDAPHLRIISDELWAATHAQLKGKKLRRGEKSPPKKKGGRPATYLLSGITKCGCCGGALTVLDTRFGQHMVKAYICSYRRDRGETVCKNALRRPVDRVNQGVVDWIQTNILSEELVVDALKEVSRRIAARAKQQNAELPKLEAEAHKLRAEIANLVDQIASSPKAVSEPLIAGLNERQERVNELDARIRATKAAPEAMSLEVRRMEAEAKARLAGLREMLERNPREARTLLSTIFDGKLTATPVKMPDGPRLQVEGRASVGRMLALEAEGLVIQTPQTKWRPQRDSNPC